MMKVYEVGVSMVRAVHEDVMPALRGSDAELASQLHRACRSVVLNVAEGAGVGRGGRRRNHWRVALGSARESRACIELAVATGVLQGDRAAHVLDRVDHVSAMLFKLIRTA